MAIIEAKGIFKSYGTVNILKGVDLNVEKGEILSVVGKSGAGKSTLLHILGTLDLPDQGQLKICGQAISGMNARQLAQFRNKHIGFVFQFHHLLPEFTALENVMIPGMVGGRKLSELQPKAKELLSYFGLQDRLNHKPTQMSGGEQQRVAFARGLINTPDVILADEPTGNLDSGNSAEMHQLILQMRKDLHLTFVIVTHNPELARLSDRCMEMKDGLIGPLTT